MSCTIRELVRAKLDAGARSVDQLWHELQREHPTHHLAWDYVQAIARQWRREREAAQAAAKPMPEARHFYTLQPGEHGKLVAGVGLVVCHPDRPPFVVRPDGQKDALNFRIEGPGVGRHV